VVEVAKPKKVVGNNLEACTLRAKSCRARTQHMQRRTLTLLMLKNMKKQAPSVIWV